MEHTNNIQHFQYILLLLIGAVTVVSVFRRLHLPPVLGYLFVGAAAGPGGFKLIPSINDMEFLAEFGVVFLMFTLGLEFSIPRLMAMRRILLGVGGLQVVTCTIIATIIGVLFNLDHKVAFIIGGALALSSTAVVIKQLVEQNEQNTTPGKLSISILLFQDIAAVIMLIIIPALSSQGSNDLVMPLIYALVKGIAVFIGMALLGQWVLRPLFHEVAKARSTELFMLATLLVALSAAWFTHLVIGSYALGAFLAGLMLGETEFRHQIEIDIRPFRDVLLGLFFIVVGALLESRNLPIYWQEVLLILISLIIGKLIIIMLVTKFMGGTDTTSAFRTGLILSQGGEFGFVVLTEAINKDIINPDQRPIVLSAIVLSLVVAPFLIRYNNQITKLFFKSKDKKHIVEHTPLQLTEHTAELSDHVIICGFGRVGQILTRFLDQENIKSIALDLDPVRISESSLAGEHSFYGDARHPETLAAAGLSRARMLVVSFSDETAALEVVMHVRSLRLDIPVFVRTKDDSNLEEFQKAGATEVVPESLEGSLMLASHLLLTLGVPTSKIIHKIRTIHSNRYSVMQGYFKGSDDTTDLEDTDISRMSLHSVKVPENSFAIGKMLHQIVGSKIDPPIKLIRGNDRHKDPALDMIIEQDDVLVFYVTPETLHVIENKILTGAEG